jgi:hypothetical protein
LVIVVNLKQFSYIPSLFPSIALPMPRPLDYCLVFFALVFLAPHGVKAADTLSAPHPAHAHNDYMHVRPLLDALDHGFRSIEADVFARGDSLYVAHHPRDIRPGRTLRKLYMEPLVRYMSGDEPVLYDSACPLILLVDIKDDGLTTYQLLDHILQDFEELLCMYGPEGYKGGRVMVVVSGNCPIEYMQQQRVRRAFVDGRVEDLDQVHPPHLMPLISDRWSKYFSWKGKGTMPEQERLQLRELVNAAHAKGRMVRFWATPDRPGAEREAVWTALLEAGVDLINTDDLEGLRTFLRNSQMSEQKVVFFVN